MMSESTPSRCLISVCGFHLEMWGQHPEHDLVGHEEMVALHLVDQAQGGIVLGF